METHNLKQAKTTYELGQWYNGKYAEMGDGWECPESEARKYLDFAMVPHDKDKLLLDVGCGAGHFIKTAQEYVSCEGIDLSEVGINMAKKRCPESIFQVRDIENDEFPSKHYDYVVSIGSVEHCISIEFALEGIDQCLKDTGMLYILVPNEEWQHFDQPNETTHTDDEWRAIFAKAGFRETKFMRTLDISHFLFVKNL